MMRNLSISLIEHEVIKTTVEKGKELRRFFEPLITRAKEDNLHNRRLVISELDSKDAVSKLFSDLGPRFKETNGGYIRLIKAGFREGDKANICFVELTCRKEVEEELSDESLIEEKAEAKEPPTKETTTKKKVEVKEPITTQKEEKVEEKAEAKEPKAKEPKAKETTTKKKVEAKEPVTKKEVEAKEPKAKEPVTKKEKSKESWWSRFFK